MISALRLALPLFALPLLSSCASSAPEPAPSTAQEASSDNTAEPEHLRAEIVAVHPFNETSFTQGLEVDEAGNLLIGTGQRGESRIYRATVDGEELQSEALDPGFFGEGITRSGEDIWQLTWQDHVAIRRDATTLAETGRVPLATEGWGICRLPDTLIYSDGTNILRTLDPDTFAVTGEIPVTSGGEPVSRLNELECTPDGQVFANVFTTTDIVRIDPASGEVTALIDASALPNNAQPDANNVLNGIAAVPGGDGRFYLSGKRWPDLYEVRFVAAN